MVPEEIIKRLEELSDNVYNLSYEDWEQGYVQGAEYAYSKCIELLKKYNPWHPYPKEEPTEDSMVLVQFDDGHVESQHFIYGDFLWDGNCVRTPVAWMKLPKLYEEEV